MKNFQIFSHVVDFSFNQGCEMVCSAPCDGSAAVTCDQVTTCSGETFGICDEDNNGVHTCVCDMDSVPHVNSLNAQGSFKLITCSLAPSSLHNFVL